MATDSQAWKETNRYVLAEDTKNDKWKKKATKKIVEVLSKINVFQKSIFRVEEVHLRHERYDGSMTQEFVRLNLDRGDSVAALLHNEEEDKVILTEQFRYPTYEKGPGWMIEIPAGIIDLEMHETPEVTIQREVIEEIGYSVQRLHHISTFYPSPGGSSERIYLFYSSVTPQDCIADGGGLIESGEDIRRLSVAVDDALAKVASGEIVDAKTVIALQWLQNHRSG